MKKTHIVIVAGLLIVFLLIKRVRDAISDFLRDLLNFHISGFFPRTGETGTGGKLKDFVLRARIERTQGF